MAVELLILQFLWVVHNQLLRKTQKITEQFCLNGKLLCLFLPNQAFVRLSMGTLSAVRTTDTAIVIAAEADQKKNDDDPAAVVSAKSEITVHKKLSLK